MKPTSVSADLHGFESSRNYSLVASYHFVISKLMFPWSDTTGPVTVWIPEKGNRTFKHDILKAFSFFSFVNNRKMHKKLITASYPLILFTEYNVQYLHLFGSTFLSFFISPFPFLIQSWQIPLRSICGLFYYLVSSLEVMCNVTESRKSDGSTALSRRKILLSMSYLWKV